ncbi:ATP-binding protein [Luteimonas terricola]|uniref:ATP-binding protein n=1 Tax=Luteimonas terricola TaxID=645597 RepID=UPI0010432FF1|nr:ATP-binding protein [Luteimonas terricola]
MTRRDSTSRSAVATQSLATLEAHAVLLRAEVAGLRAELANLRDRLPPRGGGDLLEANEQLILAALRAQAVAEAAERHREEAAARKRSIDGRQRAGTRAQHGALQEANGLLVASSLQAQAQETRALEAHAQALGSMATAAHELRNPLTPIRLAAGMLGEARDDLVRFTRLRDVIEAEVVHIARLVDDLVDGSRVVSGKLRLEYADVNLASVLESAVQTCRPAMESRHQQLVIDLPAGDAMQLHADYTRLVQVFTNLLDNASKYTPEGGRISLVAVRSPAALTVSVNDNGIGVPADALLRIFDMFVQDSAAAALRPGGLGIGLAIVRELVEAHGGTVVGSSGGRDLGSTFVVTFQASAGT